MANIENVKLKLVFDGGNIDGKDIKVNKTYSGINPEITGEGLYEAASKIVDLQNKPVLTVIKMDETILNK